MKHYQLPAVLFFLASSIFSTGTYAQGEWHYLPNTPIVPNNRYEDVYFISDTEGWAAGLNGHIIHTTDGGNSWNVNIDTFSFRKLLFLSSQLGFAGTINTLGYDSGASLLKTIDGGQTWMNLTPLLPDTPEYTAVCGMSHVGMNNIYAVGAWYQPGHFFMSHDTGNTWIYENMDSLASGLVECRFLDSLTGFISGMAPDTGFGVILKTIDGGNTWRTVFKSHRSTELVWKMQFVDSLLGYASIENVSGGDSSFIAKTTDGGETWKEKFVSTFNVNMEGIGFADSLHGWLGGWSYGSYATTDGGETWSYQNFAENLNRIFYISPTLLYGAGSSIYKYYPDTITGIQSPAPSVMPHELFPCKPDPFSGTTTISFEISEQTIIDLKVVDIRGRLVSNVMNQRLAPGFYSVPWSCPDCQTGEYIVILGTHQRYMSTRVQLVNK